MGQLTDSLRATLRDLAQSDARLYRGLQQELGDTATGADRPPAQLEGDGPASREDLEGLSIKALWALCRQRGIQGLSKGPAAKQVQALLSHPDGPPLRSTLPVKAARGTRAEGPRAAGGMAHGVPGGTALQQVDIRLNRLEQLVLLIAQRVGVPPEAIAQLLAEAPPPLR